MTVYLVFSDETGQYQRERSTRFIKKHPYYCRSGLLLSAEDWIRVRNIFGTLKGRFEIPDECELKWEHLWNRKTWNDEKFDSKYPDLCGLDYQAMLDFVETSVTELVKMDSCKFVFTVTDNSSGVVYPEDALWRFHVEDIMQRVEMQVGRGKMDLAIIFLDNLGKDVENDIRERCYELVNGDGLVHYRHIKDSVYFEYSHHSPAMQLADYCAGAFCGMLRGYADSNRIFRRLHPRIVKSQHGGFMGYGVCDVPTDKKGVRLKIEGLIQNALHA